MSETSQRIQNSVVINCCNSLGRQSVLPLELFFYIVQHLEGEYATLFQLSLSCKLLVFYQQHHSRKFHEKDYLRGTYWLDPRPSNAQDFIWLIRSSYTKPQNLDRGVRI
ncbi:hypothetical protein CPB83DRAFT_452686 [Crepidotus variabilis]|uniref:F-box domain-containing protein n=1 Tax=Crepidotus variabilis TaxID=179855 RepID=A0A9P6JNA0_9AGAR|nr:hypothetical protein CPB83DRAFT_452686 [Crepidotus variabilis]